MPRRSDERWANHNDDLRYCVFCKQYMSFQAWAIHHHNPDRSQDGAAGFFKRLLRRFRG